MNKKSLRLVYTLGTSNRSPEEFISLLKSFHIEGVVDVRRFPSSRFEHFKREKMADLLSRAGIDYYHFGAELGGFRQGGYQRFTETVEFKSGIEKLEEIAGKKNVALVCAERLPWRCHRRFIAGELDKRGWQVVHILEQGKTWVPKGGKSERQRLRLLDDQ